MTLPTEAGPGAVDPIPAGDRCPSCQAPVAGSWLACAGCGASLATAPELAPGTRLLAGRFSIGRILGRGGFGITYETDDTRLHRKVAVKELFPEAAVRHGLTVLAPPEGRPAFDQAKDRFLREARLLAQFNHPGIVRVYEVFEEHGTAYLVLELLEGRTLAEVLRERGRPFTEAAALDAAHRVGSALTVIHEAGMLHRDVSPSNMVVTGSGRIVLIDFGLARTYDAGHTAAMTRIVTPGYAPPEQYLGEARYGPATDVYGLAASLYRLLTASTMPSAIDRQHGTVLELPQRVNPGVSKLVGDAILDGLELNPDHRPQTIAAFLARLGVAQAGRSAPPLDAHHTFVEPGPAAPFPAETIVPVGIDPAPVDPLPAAGAALDDDVPRGAWDRDHPDVEEVGRPLFDEDGHWTGPAPDLPVAPVAGDGPPTLPPVVLAEPTGATVSELGAAAVIESRAHQFVVPAPAEADLDRSAGAPAVTSLDPAAYLPGPIIGPPRKGRWLASVPLTLAVVGLMSAAPVLIAAVLVLLVLPVVATVGDLALHRHRRTWGGADTWFQRRSVAAAAGPRLARNVLVSLVRALPGLVLLAVLVACWYPIHDQARLAAAADWFLRLSGVAVGLLLVVPALRGSRRFATGTTIDALHLRVAPPGVRITQLGLVVWAVGLALGATGLLFTPDVWPLAG